MLYDGVNEKKIVKGFAELTLTQEYIKFDKKN